MIYGLLAPSSRCLNLKGSKKGRVIKCESVLSLSPTDYFLYRAIKNLKKVIEKSC